MADINDDSWRNDWSYQPWRSFFINEKHYLLKTHFSEIGDGYKVCISDFQKILFETLDHDAIKTRAKELNPNIEADMSYIMKHVKSNMERQQPLSSYQMIQKEESDNNLVLHLKTKLPAGVSFVWEFHCNSSDELMMSLYLLEPLVDMVAELQRRQSELQNLLKKKDLEINDYRESGVKLSNKRMATKQFDQEAFNNKMLLSAGFGDTVQRSKTLAFTEGLQDLYKQVMLKRTRLTQEGLREIDEQSALGTERGVTVPSSVFSDSSPNMSPQVSPRETPLTSPKKSATATASLTEVLSNQDRELQRREELQRKLAEEAEKKKRKKRKIKL